VTTICFLYVIVTAFGIFAPSLRSKISQYEQVTALIESGNLSHDKDGLCVLPNDHSSLTPDGKVWVARSPSGKLRILFPTWYGRGSDVDGYLYADGNLAPSEIYAIDWGSGGSHQHINVGSASMLSFKDLKPNWYWVTRRLD
jgi:hypothetical protein